MLKLKKIAITGGIASGKSTVCQLFSELGAYVVHADTLTHELLQLDTDLGQQIVKQLGPEIIEKGQISRRKIADKVFHDPIQLKKLEELIHPAVLKQIESSYLNACRAEKFTLFVVEIPLLFEIKSEGFYDAVIVVLTPDAVAKKRFEQAGFPNTEYDLRMKRQMKPELKAAKAHFTIHNQGSLEELRREVIHLNQIIQQSKRDEKFP